MSQTAATIAGPRRRRRHVRFGTVVSVAAVVALSSGCGSDDPGTEGHAAPSASAPVTEPPSTDGSRSSEPEWLRTWLHGLESGEDSSPPRQITRYQSGDATYYLVDPGCCDQFIALLDANGELVGYPSGGIDGEGDGTTNFVPTSAGEVLWLDE